MRGEAQTRPRKSKKSSEFKKLTKERKVFCLRCGSHFRNRYVYAGHAKIHYKDAIESIRKSKLGDLNPVKRLDVRRKISKSLKGNKAWNKNIKWTKDKRHNKIVDKYTENLKASGLKVLTTHYYVPDAIIIDFDKRIVKAFELNPGSIISKGLRAKDKGYDFMIVKVDRNGKYARKNMEREIPATDL